MAVRANHDFPIVGIGASAGGLEAIQPLLERLPSNSGLAFVFVQHLDPHHESALVDILSKSSKIPVIQIENGMQIERNHLYIIPPNANIALTDGSFSVRSRDEKLNKPIDLFFQTLAKVKGKSAVGVILSGSGSDGALGLAAIKAEEGITFAQELKSAKYDQMPLSAIDQGCVDFVLKPADIAKELLRVGRHPYLKVAKETDGTDEFVPESDTFHKILTLLRLHAKVDFTQYKQSTLNRRILKRMLFHRIESFENYLAFLKKTPNELELLFHDLLINVTSFFRDPEAFEALKETVFPALLKKRNLNFPIRIWVPGCSTGEEVYSIAMAYLESAGPKDRATQVQIFATDISPKAIDGARRGVYTAEALKGNVSSERLRRFFDKVESGYAIRKQIRDLCVFAVQDVTSDPPFSRVDLISCRNLLIYLGAGLQKKVIPMFHYALNEDGFLFLGNSETISGFSDLFSLKDKKHKIYSKLQMSSKSHFGFALPPLFRKESDKKQIPHAAGETAATEVEREAQRILLSDYTPCGAIVNDDMEVIQFQGDTSFYLAPPPGKATLNLLRMVRHGLALDVRSLLNKSKKERKSVKKEGLHVKRNGQNVKVCIRVIPLKSNPASGNYFLVLFQETSASTDIDAPRKTSPRGKESLLGELERQLALKENGLAGTRENLQATIEAQEAMNEELKSANEEILSSNEELQSTNEELETSKEELQSMNEELSTLNDELRNKNVELGQLNNDLTNLLNSIKIPMVMVGNDLRIRRFNPAAEKFLKLIPSDIGRPITDLKPNIMVPNLEQLLLEVIETTASKELEVFDQEKYWYRIQVRQYRTDDNRIDGAIITMVDINALKFAIDYTQNIIRTVPLSLIVLDGDLRVITGNQFFYTTFQVSPEETEGKLIYDIGNGQWNIPKLRKLLEDILPENTAFDNFEITHSFPGIGRKTMLLNARRILQEGTEMKGMILLAIQDVTERKKMDQLRIDEMKNDLMSFAAHQLKNPEAQMKAYIDNMLSGYTGKFTKKQKEYLGKIYALNTENIQLISNLLNVAQIDRGEIALDIKPLQLKDMVKKATEDCLNQIKAKGLTLKVMDGKPIEVLADYHKAIIALKNVLENAIRFTDRGTITIQISNRDHSGIIEIHDTGTEIPDEIFPKLFKKELAFSHDRRRGGSGLGLYIAKSFMKLQQGDLTASTVLGKGSAFRFTFLEAQRGESA